MTLLDAESIVAQAADAYRVAFGARLIAAYALGSLAHGGFSPLVSDIDLGLIVADPLRGGGVRSGAGGPASQGLGSLRPAGEGAEKEIRCPERLVARGVRRAGSGARVRCRSPR